VISVCKFARLLASWRFSNAFRASIPIGELEGPVGFFLRRRQALTQLLRFSVMVMIFIQFHVTQGAWLFQIHQNRRVETPPQGGFGLGVASTHKKSYIFVSESPLYVPYRADRAPEAFAG